MIVTLESGMFGWDYLLAADSGDVRLIQDDWNYPAVAASFGWSPCPCGKTDGTVDCPHRTTGQMIADAQQFLDDHIGDTIDDPGYFAESEGGAV